MLTVLIIRGATLSGAMEGVKFYMGTVNLSALKSPNVSTMHQKNNAGEFNPFLSRFGKKLVHKCSTP